MASHEGYVVLTSCGENQVLIHGTACTVGDLKKSAVELWKGAAAASPAADASLSPVTVGPSFLVVVLRSKRKNTHDSQFHTGLFSCRTNCHTGCHTGMDAKLTDQLLWDRNCMLHMRETAEQSWPDKVRPRG